MTPKARSDIDVSGISKRLASLEEAVRAVEQQLGIDPPATSEGPSRAREGDVKFCKARLTHEVD